MKFASFAVISLCLVVLFINYDVSKSENFFDREVGSNGDLFKRERLLSLLKRKLANDALELQRRSDDSSEDSNSDKDNANDDDDKSITDGKNYKSIGTGITIPLANGDSVNICDGKYITIAAAVHDRIRDLLISACSGASGIIF